MSNLETDTINYIKTYKPELSARGVFLAVKLYVYDYWFNYDHFLLIMKINKMVQKVRNDKKQL